jgi:hypothetical protein
MLDGWRAQMLARGLAVDTIKARCRLVRRFVEFTNEYPWRWRPIDVDHFLAELRSQETPIVLSTLRTYSNAIAMFCSYVSDSKYGWAAFCEKQFGDVPSQICFEWNTPQHTTDDALPPKRRAFAKPELQHLFDVIDDFVDQRHQMGSKRWLGALRDSIAFKVCYAYRDARLPPPDARGTRESIRIHVRPLHRGQTGRACIRARRQPKP